MSIKNKVQLITYPDSLGGNLKILNEVLHKYFENIFRGGIHILPPFPSSGDRGFAPLTYLEIDPQFGNWQDIREIGKEHDVLLDFTVNHISAQSKYFKDFLKHGNNSKYADLFLTINKIFPDGNPDREEIEKIFLRRENPYSDFTIKKTGEVERIWTSFGKVTPSEQIDLDVTSELTKELFREFMNNFSKNNVKIVRLDAIGFIVKKLGTSCFMVEPEIYDHLEWIKKLADPLDIEILPEVHAHYTTQFKLADKGFWIYNFVLPYMILESLMFGNSERLKSYLKVRPQRQFTMLDCHDGVPIMPDLNDLVDVKDIKKVVDLCLQRGANLSLIFSPKHRTTDGFNVHQIRGSYYSLLNSDDDAYIAARAIQLFVPGIPQIYYVGLLAGENDFENVNRTGEGREINRHNFTLDEIENAVQKDVVKRLIKLMKFRNEYPAFDGNFKVLDSSDNSLKLAWYCDSFKCGLEVDLINYQSTITFNDIHGNEEIEIF